MVNILNEPDADPSYYPAFRDFLEGTIQNSRTAFPSSAGLLQEGVFNLGKEVDLWTGRCMSIIWKAARPLVPATKETWIAYEEILSVIAQFERDVVFQIGTFLLPLPLSDPVR